PRRHRGLGLRVAAALLNHLLPGGAAAAAEATGEQAWPAHAAGEPDQIARAGFVRLDAATLAAAVAEAWGRRQGRRQPLRGVLDAHRLVHVDRPGYADRLDAVVVVVRRHLGVVADLVILQVGRLGGGVLDLGFDHRVLHSGRVGIAGLDVDQKE